MNRIETTIGTYLMFFALNFGGNITSFSDNSYSDTVCNVSQRLEYYSKYPSNLTDIVDYNYCNCQFEMLFKFASSIINESFELEPEILELVDDIFFDLI